MVGETSATRIAKYVTVAIVTLILLFPIYWMINMSFKGQTEFVAEPPTLLVQHPT
jgi:multiple sugar transport system permease protein